MPTTTQSPKLSDAERKDALIAVWLRKYRALYPTYREAITPEKIDLYCELLADMSMSDLQLGLERAAKTLSEFPLPADIRSAAEAAARDAAALAETYREPRDYGDCQFCGGTGMETVQIRGMEAAQRCRCRAPGYVAPAPKPRALISSGEAAEIALALRGRAL